MMTCGYVRWLLRFGGTLENLYASDPIKCQHDSWESAYVMVFHKRVSVYSFLHDGGE